MLTEKDNYKIIDLVMTFKKVRTYIEIVIARNDLAKLKLHFFYL